MQSNTTTRLLQYRTDYKKYNETQPSFTQEPGIYKEQNVAEGRTGANG